MLRQTPVIFLLVLQSSCSLLGDDPQIVDGSIASDALSDTTDSYPQDGYPTLPALATQCIDDTGVCCEVGQWCWQHPLPGVSRIFSLEILSTAPLEYMTVGSSAAYRYRSDQTLQTNTGVSGPLTNVWGLSADDVYATSNDTIHHYDGSRWRPILTATDVLFGGIWGSNDGNTIVAVGGKLGRSTAWRFDRKRWTEDRFDRYQPHEAKLLHDVWGRNATDIFATGEGSIFHYDGTAWTSLRPLLDALPDDSTRTSELVAIEGNTDGMLIAGNGVLLQLDTPADRTQWRVRDLTNSQTSGCRDFVFFDVARLSDNPAPDDPFAFAVGHREKLQPKLLEQRPSQINCRDPGFALDSTAGQVVSVTTKNTTTIATQEQGPPLIRDPTNRTWRGSKKALAGVNLGLVLSLTGSNESNIWALGTCWAGDGVRLASCRSMLRFNGTSWHAASVDSVSQPTRDYLEQLVYWDAQFIPDATSANSDLLIAIASAATADPNITPVASLQPNIVLMKVSGDTITDAIVTRINTPFSRGHLLRDVWSHPVDGTHEVLVSGSQWDTDPPAGSRSPSFLRCKPPDSRTSVFDYCSVPTNWISERADGAHTTPNSATSVEGLRGDDNRVFAVGLETLQSSTPTTVGRLWQRRPNGQGWADLTPSVFDPIVSTLQHGYLDLWPVEPNGVVVVGTAVGGGAIRRYDTDTDRWTDLFLGSPSVFFTTFKAAGSDIVFVSDTDGTIARVPASGALPSLEASLGPGGLIALWGYGNTGGKTLKTLVAGGGIGTRGHLVRVIPEDPDGGYPIVDGGPAPDLSSPQDADLPPDGASDASAGD